MLASSVEHGLGARSCMAVRAIRDLSQSIASQAEIFGGISDGKSGAPSLEVS
jgi:hypothetical protein